MSSALISDSFDVDAILAGAGDQLAELVRCQPVTEPALATTFWSSWRERSALHAELLAACEPLSAALAGLIDPVLWAAVPGHPVWRVLELVQHSGAGYQPELGRAGEKILVELGAAAEQAGRDGWAAAATALESWWTQEQQRLGRLEQRLMDTERGQLRSRRAQQVAARVLNQNMAGKRFAREVADYLQREWFQELQWALLQFGVDSEQWQRRAQLTERLVISLQPATDDDEAQQLYALIPEVGAELAAVLDERAHDRNVLEQQLALIEAQHLLLLRGQEPPAADFQLIANNDPWLSTTTISASLLQRVAVLEPGSWFVLRESSGELRIKLVLKLDDSTQLLFVNRLGVKVLQKSFEEFAYLLSVGAAQQLPRPDCAREFLRDILGRLLSNADDDEQARAEARRLVEGEARLRVEAKAKALAEAQALAEALAEAEAAQRVREEQIAQEEEQRRQELARRDAELQQERTRQLEAERRQREAAEQEAQRRAASEPVAVSVAPAEEQPIPPVVTPADEQRLRAARREAGLVPLGTWIELIDAAGTAQRLKVAVKLPSSGKLILVDRDGVRQAELDREAFASLLFEERARILNQGPKFEDTLAKVVDSMRRDRAPRE